MNTGVLPSINPTKSLSAEPRRDEPKSDEAFNAALSLVTPPPAPVPVVPVRVPSAASLAAQARPKTELEQRATVDVSRMAAEELRKEGSKQPAPEKPVPGDSARDAAHPRPARDAGLDRQSVPGQPRTVGSEPARDATLSGVKESTERVVRSRTDKATMPESGAGSRAGNPHTKTVSPAMRMMEGLAGAGAATAARTSSTSGTQPTRGLGVGTVTGAGKKAGLVRTPVAQAPRPDRSLQAQAMRGIAAALKQGGGSVTLRIDPEHLGMLKVRVEVKGSKVTASVETGSEVARRLLDEGRESLRAALEARGLTVERVDVRLNEHLSEGVTDDAGWKGQGGGGEDAAGSWTPEDGGDRRGGTNARESQEGRTEASQPAAEPRPDLLYASAIRPEGDRGVLNAVA